MKFPCIESTIDVYYGNRSIRLWINEQELKNSYELSKKYGIELNEFINKRREELAQARQGLESLTYQELVEYVQKNIPNVNAVQIREKVGSLETGVVVYFVDFGDKDPHG